MPKIKAVELMRKIRDDLESRYAQLSLKERTEKIRKEVEANPLWKDFLQRDQSVGR
mgnify:CR=1 FL=1